MNWVDTIQSDLKLMKEMAEKGGRLTMPGGEYYVLWGLAVGLGLSWNLLVGAQILALPYWTIWAGWIALMTVASAIMSVFIRRDEARPDSQKLANRIVAQAWMMAGLSTFVVFLAAFAGAQLQLPHALPPTVIAMHAFFASGIAVGFIAGLVNLRWMYLVSALWFAGGIAVMLMTWTVVSVGLLTAYVTALHVGTGVVLLRHEAAARG